MYTRQAPDGRFPRPMRLPQNYSGNAFRSDPSDLSNSSDSSDSSDSSEASGAIVTPEEKASRIPTASEAPREALPLDLPEDEPKAREAGKLLSSPGFRLDVGRLFRREVGGFGVEELLILGLILLVASGDKSDELVLLLLLLLLID